MYDFEDELRGDMGDAVSGGQRVASWFDYLVNGLTLMGIVALVGVTWNLGNTVTRIDTHITEKEKQYDRDFDRIDRTLTRHDERLAGLEREQRNPLPNPDHRQKRQ